MTSWQKLYQKMEDEYQEYKTWLLGQEPETILENSWDYAKMTDTIDLFLAFSTTGDAPYTEEEIQYLLECDEPLRAICYTLEPIVSYDDVLSAPTWIERG